MLLHVLAAIFAAAMSWLGIGIGVALLIAAAIALRYFGIGPKWLPLVPLALAAAHLYSGSLVQYGAAQDRAYWQGLVAQAVDDRNKLLAQIKAGVETQAAIDAASQADLQKQIDGLQARPDCAPTTDEETRFAPFIPY